jgi:hypothetical protein
MSTDPPLRCHICGATGLYITVSETTQMLAVNGQPRLHARATCHNSGEHPDHEEHHWWSRNSGALARSRAARDADTGHAEMSRG